MNERPPVTVVAEAAQGFEGDPTLARMLVRAAHAGHADMVKFQLVYAAELATPRYPYYALFQQLEMPLQAWESVAHEAQQRHLGLAFDVFGLESLTAALSLGARAVKIHSADLYNDALVDRALAESPRVLISVAGATADEIGQLLTRMGREVWTKVMLLHGFQAEPTPIGEMNLARLAALRSAFPQVQIGFMDHTPGDSDEAGWLGLLALPFGVSMLEKHITIDRSLNLEDAVSALRAAEFARYVARVRSAEQALGTHSLDLSTAEEAYRRKALKAVVAARAIIGGTTLSADDLALLRAPLQDGRQPLRRPADAVGRRLRRAVEAGEPLYAGDVT